MAKPLKFHQTLNQAPRSLKHGKHRRAGTPAHSRSLGGADHRARGSNQGIAWTTVNFTSRTFIAWDLAYTEPAPPTIPYAGIRTGEIIGHRLWWVIGGKLCSLAHRRLWVPGETVKGETNKPVDGDYWKVIWGGTYAFAEAEQCRGEINDIVENIAKFKAIYGDRGLTASFGWVPYCETMTFVRGTVKMWGDVVEHETGYRAEFAKLHSLDELFGDGDLDALRRTYGVGALQP